MGAIVEDGSDINGQADSTKRSHPGADERPERGVSGARVEVRDDQDAQRPVGRTVSGIQMRVGSSGSRRHRPPVPVAVQVRFLGPIVAYLPAPAVPMGDGDWLMLGSRAETATPTHEE
jgi:hypothetical protein